METLHKAIFVENLQHFDEIISLKKLVSKTSSDKELAIASNRQSCSICDKMNTILERDIF